MVINNSDGDCTHGNVNDDIVDDELLINFFENESSKVDMDEGSGLNDDSTAYSDECGATGHTILKKKPTCTQKQYIPNAGDIIAKKEG
eukprot:13379536-Ditylum_brightwellii.AAC.1